MFPVTMIILIKTLMAICVGFKPLTIIVSEFLIFFNKVYSVFLTFHDSMGKARKPFIAILTTITSVG